MNLIIKKIVPEEFEKSIERVETIYAFTPETTLREVMVKVFGEEKYYEKNGRPEWQYQSELIVKLVKE